MKTHFSIHNDKPRAKRPALWALIAAMTVGGFACNGFADTINGTASTRSNIDTGSVNTNGSMDSTTDIRDGVNSGVSGTTSGSYNRNGNASGGVSAGVGGNGIGSGANVGVGGGGVGVGGAASVGVGR